GGSGLHDRESGHFTECVGHAFDLFLLEIFRADHAHAGGRLIERNIKTRGRDDNLFNLRVARRRNRRSFLRDANDWREREQRKQESVRSPKTKPNWTISHNKFPPTPRVGLARVYRRVRPALILLFAKKFFRSPQ